MRVCSDRTFRFARSPCPASAASDTALSSGCNARSPPSAHPLRIDSLSLIYIIAMDITAFDDDGGSNKLPLTEIYQSLPPIPKAVKEQVHRDATHTFIP